MACAGGNSQSIWTLDPALGGSKADPMFMHHVEFAGVTIGHSSAFTYDGKYAIFGHEPGGGARRSARRREPRRTARSTSSTSRRATIAGSYVQERPQTNLENCTWHNLNIVPLDKNQKPRYVLVAGNYQIGHPGRRLHRRNEREDDRVRRSAAARRPDNPTASSSAATGRATGTTAASTNPTSRGA